MSDYGDQFRQARERRRKAIVDYCVCGGSLLATQKTCYRCDSPNHAYRPPKPKQ